MNINTKSWHYKVYDFSYAMNPWGPPAQTNLCQYCRRLVFVAPLLALLMVIMFAFYGVFFVIKSLAFLVIGYRPNSWQIDKQAPYPGLKLGAFQLYPWHILAPIAAVYLEYLLIHYCGWKWPLIVEGSLLAVAGLLIGLLFLPDTEGYHLAASWIAAKKQNICPVVTFDNRPTSEE